MQIYPTLSAQVIFRQLHYSGKPRSNDFHWKYYKELLKKAGLPDIRWHDLHSTYCTLLLKKEFNPKAVSKLMGHAGEIITVDVYGDNRNIIPEEIPELSSYMDEVMPKKRAEETSEDRTVDTVVEPGWLFACEKKIGRKIRRAGNSIIAEDDLRTNVWKTGRQKGLSVL